MLWIVDDDSIFISYKKHQSIIITGACDSHSLQEIAGMDEVIRSIRVRVFFFQRFWRSSRRWSFLPCLLPCGWELRRFVLPGQTKFLHFLDSLNWFFLEKSIPWFLHFAKIRLAKSVQRSRAFIVFLFHIYIYIYM